MNPNKKLKLATTLIILLLTAAMIPTAVYATAINEDIIVLSDDEPEGLTEIDILEDSMENEDIIELFDDEPLEQKDKRPMVVGRDAYIMPLLEYTMQIVGCRPSASHSTRFN